MKQQVIEGTWEEIATRATEFAGSGKRLMLIVPLDEEYNETTRRKTIDRARNENTMIRSPSQTMTPDEFDKRFDEIADLVDPSVPPLSDYAVSRESIYD